MSWSGNSVVEQFEFEERNRARQMARTRYCIECDGKGYTMEQDHEGDYHKKHCDYCNGNGFTELD